MTADRPGGDTGAHGRDHAAKGTPKRAAKKKAKDPAPDTAKDAVEGTKKTTARRTGPTPGGPKQVDVIAALMRDRINSEEWPIGFFLPSETTLALEFGTSKQTLRNALDVLLLEGRIRKRQGLPSQVVDRTPTHRLRVRLPRAEPGQRLERVAEPPVLFAGGTSADEVRREHKEETGSMPRAYAKLVGLKPDARVVERTIRLLVGHDPILTSTSYLPMELADNPWWQATEIGQLAVVDRAVTAERFGVQIRMPGPPELEILGMDRGVSMIILSYPCQVRHGERTVPAGVIVLARSDQVCLDGGAEPQP